jgi:hypothetical protein
MSAFWTDSDRTKALAEAFELDKGELHPNTREFFDRYVNVLDSERAAYMISLVNHAKYNHQP